MRKASNLQYAWLGFFLSLFLARKVADMPKLFSSDDPFGSDELLGTAREDHRHGRRHASIFSLLLVPTLGLAVLAYGMQPRHSAGTVMSLMASGEPEKKPSLCERRARQLITIEAARQKVLYWRRENCGGRATPHSRAKLTAWEHGYQHRLALFARMYPR